MQKRFVVHNGGYDRYFDQEHFETNQKSMEFRFGHASCELRAASCDLRAWLLYRVPELRVASCVLRPATCALRTATCEMMNCEMRHASWDLRPAYRGSSDLVIQTAWVYNLCASYKGNTADDWTYCSGADLLCLVWDNISVPSLTGLRKTWQGDPRP